MAIGISNFQFIFKTLFPSDQTQWLIPDNLPLLNMIPRSDNLSGDLVDHPLKTGAAQGYSQDYNTAAAQAGAPNRGARAQIRVSQAYKLVEFFDKDKALSEGDGAYVDLIEDTMRGVLMDVNKNFDLDLHGAGTGWRGTVIAVAGQSNPNVPGQTLAAGQIALAQGYAVEATFDQDQQIQAATWTGFPLQNSIFPPSDGRAPTSLSVPVQVLSVDPVGRVLTLTDASAFTVGSFIVQSGGALGFNSQNLNGAFIGLDAWNPYGGVTSSDAFCNINRSIYSTRMAGYSLDAQKFSIEDGIKRLSARMSQGGARTSNVGLVNPIDFDVLDSKLGSAVRYGSVSTATYGFDSIVINGAAGRIDIVADPHQPQGYARLIDPSTWLLRHKYDVPHLVDVESRTMEQGGNFDGRTCRVRIYAQLFCKQPHKNGIVRLPYVGI